MSQVFLKLVNMGISAGWIVLAVCLCRLLFKKMPKWITVLLWGIVALRLICPFTVESMLSLIPSKETVSPDIMMDATPELNTGIPELNGIINPSFTQSFTPDLLASANPLQIFVPLAALVWGVGVVAILGYGFFSYVRVRRKVKTAVLLEKGIYQCETVGTPFVLGLIKPTVYLPFSMDEKDMDSVIAHEKAHIQRKDHLWKPLGYLLLAVYWFHPLIWLGYILLCRDIELACDEKVIRDMDVSQRADYTEALLKCAVNHPSITACPLAFGEVGVKKRVKTVLRYKKPAFWLLILGIILCGVLAICFLTDPVTPSEEILSFVEEAVWEHNEGKYYPGTFRCADLAVLGTRREKNTTTVYLWVLYQEYDKVYERVKDPDGSSVQVQRKVKHISGGHTPTVVTVKEENKQLFLVEYWEPRDGSLWEQDIREKFPWYLQAKAMNGQRYIKEQQKNCLEKAERYFLLNAPETENIFPYETTVSFGNWSDSKAFFEESIGDNTPLLDAEVLPVHRLDTREDLSRFMEKYEDIYTLDQGLGEVPSFSETVAPYDEAFFRNNSLLLIYQWAGNSTHRFRVDKVELSPEQGTLNVFVVETTRAEFVNAMMAGWFLTVTVPDDILETYRVTVVHSPTIFE